LVGYIKRIFKWGVSRQIVPPNIHTSLTTVEGHSSTFALFEGRL